MNKFKIQSLRKTIIKLFNGFIVNNLKRGLAAAIVLLLILLLGFSLSQTHKKPVKPKPNGLEAYVSKITFPKKDPNVKRTVQKEKGYTFTTAEKGNISDPVSFAANGGQISFTSLQNQALGGLNNSGAKVQNGKTIYNNIYNGVNLIYTPSQNGILEEYEVLTPHNTINNIVQKIDLSNVTYKFQSDGSIIFYNKKNQFAFAIPKPVMYEKYNPKERSYNLHYEIFSEGGNTFLAKVIDQKGREWLSKSNYPVEIDATILLTLFSYQSYPTTAGNWQVSIDTVGSGNLTIQPVWGTKWQDLNLVSLTCGGNPVQYQQSKGEITISNYSCGQNTVITTKVNNPAKQNYLEFGWSGYSTVVSSIAYNGKPVIISSSLNPAVVKIGDTITVKTEVSDQNGVKSVTADMGGIQMISLSLTSGTPQDGIWQGKWVVKGTGTKPYGVTITASNDTQTISSSIGFFDPYSCSGGGDLAGANFDPASACPSGFYGTFSNIGTLSVASSETATVTAYNGTVGGTASMSASLVDIEGTITVNSSGYAQGTGPGAGGGGGGYGGTGGGGGATYGSLTAPTDLGSGGGAGNSTGGAGGGAIRISTTGTLTVNGTITSNGGAGAGGCYTAGSGGSGGSIYLTSGTLAGNGTITANGGAGGSGCGNNGGNGGGGRIAIYYTSANNFTGTTTVSPGTFSSGAAGGSGTAFIENSNTHDLLIPANNGTWNGSDRTAWNFASLTINGNITFKSSNATLLTITVGGATTIASGVTITAAGSYTTGSNGVGIYFNLLGNVTIPATSTITVDSQGYAQGTGPGAGGGGGGYGGTGGGGGATYGSLTAPTDLGSGGGAGNSTGGAGGGAIRISTTGTLTVNGTITSNGGAGAGGCYTAGSGGSGGSIYLTSGTLAGNGTITANGGAGGSGCGNNGGNGGGGRIAIYYTSANNFTGTTTVSPGTFSSGAAGGSGTINTALDNAPTISNLAQYQTDCTTSLAVGGTLQGNNLGSTGCFKAALNSGNASDTFAFQVEAEPIGTSFTNLYSTQSAGIAFSGSAITATVSQAGFVLGTSYHWQARVVDSKGASSAWTSFGGNPESSPDFTANVPPPTNTTATYNSDTQITVAWQNTAQNVVNFTVQRSTNGGAYTTVGTTADGNTLTFVDNSTNDPSSPPVANDSYQYQIKSNFNGYASNYGTASSLVYTTPAAPSGVTISQTAVGSITIDWTNNANYQTAFQIQRKIGSGAYSTITSTVSPSSTSFVDTNVEQGTTYTYQVAAIRTSPDALTSAYAQPAGSVNITEGFGKGVYLTQNGTLIAQNNFKNSIDVFNNIQNNSTDVVGQNITYDSSHPSLGPNLPSGSTLNGLTVAQGVSTVDGKSDVIYVATSNGLVAINQDALTPALGGVKYYTNTYISEMMYGDIRGMWPLDSSVSAGLGDVSNKGETLTNNGSISFASSGVRGTAATLNGTSQYLSLADNADLSVTGDLSFGAWFKTTSTVTSQTILAKNGSYTLGLTSSGTLTASVIGSTTGTVTGSTVLDTGWHHAVVVYSSSSQSLSLYLDGQLEASTTSSVPSSITDSTGAFDIGANAGSSLFSGNIDEAFVTATVMSAGEVSSMYLTGLRALQNHPGNIITGVSTNNYQRLLGNGTGDSTVNNVQAVAVDGGNQFIYAGTNDLTANTGGTTVIGVHSDSVSDLYASTNTAKKDDLGNLFNANDAVAVSTDGIPNPAFNTTENAAQNGGVVAIAGTNDVATRLWIGNQSYSLTQVLSSGSNSGGSKTSFNVNSLFTVGNVLGQSASTSGEILQLPAFQVDQNGIVEENYLGTDGTANALTFNGSGITTGNVLNISAPSLTTGNAISVIDSGTGGYAINARSIGSGLTNVALYASASGATNNYAALFPLGSVGIGTTAPVSLLDVTGPPSISGTGTVTSSGRSITGTGTAFTTQLQVGDILNASGSAHVVVSIASDTSLTVDGAFSPNATNAPFTITPAIGRFVSNSGTQQYIFNNSGITANSSIPALKLEDTQTGGEIYDIGNGKVSPGILSIADLTQGTQPFNITSAGYIGLGTTSPTAVLDVNGNASIAGQLTFESGYGTIQTTKNQLLTLGGNSTGDIQFKPGNSSSSLYLSSTGNVGVGTTVPNANLEVAAGSPIIRINSNTTSVNQPKLQFYSSYSNTSERNWQLSTSFTALGDFNIRQSNAQNGDPEAAGTTRFYIDPNGNVGIGTTAPGAKLQVTGAAGQSTLIGDWGGSSSYAAISFNGSLATGNYNILSSSSDQNLYINRPTGKDIRFRENNVDQMTIQGSTGYVGIGTTTPGTKLEVDTNTHNALTLVDTNGGSGNTVNLFLDTYVNSNPESSIQAQDNGDYSSNILFSTKIPGGANNGLAERMRITSSGNVGIGTSAPIGLLNGVGAVTGQALVNLNYTGTDQNILTASSSGTTVFALSNTGNLISTAGAQWKPFTDSTTALQIANSAGSSIMSFDTINNRVGIGTANPNFKLSLQDTQISTATAMFANLSTSPTADVLALKVATTSSQLGNYFTTFLDGNGNILGKIQGNGSGGVSYATNGIDFAEYYRKDNSSDNLKPGDVVCLSQTGGALKCSASSSASLLGVVSNQAGFIGGGNYEGDPSYVLVGIIGQLSVKVSSQSGVINPSDPLSVLPDGGVGKATNAGYILGHALGAYDPSNPVSTIPVSINVSWYDPIAYSQNSSSSASLSGVYTNLNLLSSRVNSLQNLVLFNSTASSFLTSSVNASLSAELLSPSLLNVEDATISANLNVLGRTTLSDLGVTGTINSGLLVINGLDNSVGSNAGVSINTLSGDLYLQNEGWGGVNILAGKVTIDSQGNVNVAGVLGANTVEANQYFIKGTGSTGSAVLPAGVTQIEVDTSSMQPSSKVFVTPTTLTGVPLSVTYKANGKFIVQIESAQASDIKFDWWVLGVK